MKTYDQICQIINQKTNPDDWITFVEKMTQVGIDIKATTPSNSKVPEFDMIISGGGYYMAFVMAIIPILHDLEEQQKIKIVRISGTSAGGTLALLYASGVRDCVSVFKNAAGVYQTKKKMKLMPAWHKALDEVLPKDAYIKCSGRFHIGLTKVTGMGLKSVKITNFTSNDDLIRYCCAAGQVPFYSSNSLFFSHNNNWFLDGGFLENVPFFRDNLRPQLTFLPKLKYNSSYFSKFDEHFECYTVEGRKEFEKFQSGNSDCIRIHKAIHRNNNNFKRIIMLGLIVLIFKSGFI